MKNKAFGITLIILCFLCLGTLCLGANSSLFANSLDTYAQSQEDTLEDLQDDIVYGNGMSINPTLLKILEDKYPDKTNDYNENHSDVVLPSRYCIRDDYILYTQDQNPDGLCWDFASSQTLSTTLTRATGEYYDFSEGWVSLILDYKGEEIVDMLLALPEYSSLSYYRDTLVNTINLYNVGEGGWFFLFDMVLKTYGMVLEADFDYNNFTNANPGNFEEYFNYYSQFAITEYKDNVVPVRFGDNNYSKSANTRNSMKYHILNNGGIYTALYWADCVTKTVNGKQITYKQIGAGNALPKDERSGHAVTIIGWDDNISIDGNVGAWVVLNSWGDDWGTNGIFYLSYADTDYNEYFFGYVYEENEDDAFDLTLNNTIQSAEYGYYVTDLKGAYYGNFNATNSATNQRNVFFSQNVNLSYNYVENTDVILKNVKVYRVTEDFSEDFNININRSYKTISISNLSGNKVEPGAYKVVSTYSNNGVMEQEINIFYVCDGAEIGFVLFFYSTIDNNVKNNNQYLMFNNFNSGKTELIVGGTITGENVFYINAYPTTYSTFSTVLIYATSRGTSRVFNVSDLFGGNRKYAFSVKPMDAGDKLIETRYDLDGGRIADSSRKEMDRTTSNLSLLQVGTPTKTGYEFDGWYLDKSFTKKITNVATSYTHVGTPTHCTDSTYYGEANTIFAYAKWKKISKTVTFVDSYSGNELEVDFGIGELIEMPTSFVRDHYEIEGWYTTSTFDAGTKWDFDHDVLTEDIVLYVNWQVEKLTVTLDFGGGVTDTVQVEYNTKLTEAQVNEKLISKAHYTFSGWYTSSSFNTPYNFNNNVTSAITIYAKWLGEVVYVTIHNSTLQYRQFRYGDKIIGIIADNKAHYDFVGWYTSSSFSPSTYWDLDNNTLNGDVDLYPKYEIQKVDVTLNYGNTNTEIIKVDWGTRLDEQLLLTKLPNRPHYDFKGWFTSSSYSDGSEWIFDTTIENAITLYAKWEAEDLNVVIHFNDDITPNYNLVAKYDQKIQGLENPSRAHYNFMGWYTTSTFDDDTEWDLVNDVVLSNMDLYAKWQIEQFNVTLFFWEGNTTVLQMDYNSSLSEMVATSYLPNRTHYEFIGWYDKDGVQFNFPLVVESDVTIYANWQVTDKMQVRYHFNDGETADVIEYVLFDSKIVRPQDPTRLHYLFVGWYIDEDLQSAWDFNSDVVTDDVNLYAKWNQNEFAITFHAGIGNDATLWATRVVWTVINTKTTVPTFTDDDYDTDKYNTDGWYRSPLFKENEKFDTDITRISGTLDLYAKLIQVRFDVVFNLNGADITEMSDFVRANISVDDENQTAYCRFDYNANIGNMTLTKIGFMFIGFAINGDLANIWDLDNGKVKSDMTLDSVFQLEVPTVVLKIYDDGIVIGNTELITFTNYILSVDYEHPFKDNMLGVSYQIMIDNELRGVYNELPLRFVESGVFEVSVRVSIYYDDTYSSNNLETLTLYVANKPLNIDKSSIVSNKNSISWVDTESDGAVYIIELYKWVRVYSQFVTSSLGLETFEDDEYECVIIQTWNNVENSSVEINDVIRSNGSGKYYASITKVVGDDVIGSVDGEPFEIVSLFYDARFNELNKLEYYDKDEGVNITYFPSKDGYRFNAWYDSDDLLGNKVNRFVISENSRIYAGWEIIGVFVNLMLQGQIQDMQTTYNLSKSYIFNAEIDTVITYTCKYFWHKVSAFGDEILNESLNTLSIQKVKDSGKYYCSIEITDSIGIVNLIKTNEINVTINKADTRVLLLEDVINERQFTYDGIEHQINFGAKLDRSDDMVHIQYYKNAERTSSATFKDVPVGGKFRVYAYAPESDNYNSAMSFFDVVVNKAKSEITLDRAQLLVYTGKSLMPSYTLNNSEQYVSLSQQVINSGIYSDLVLTANESTNYKATTVNVSIMVDPARVVIRAKDVSSLWLFGKVDLDYEIVSGYNGDPKDLKVTLSCDVDTQKIGNYVISANIDNSNYNVTIIKGTYNVNATPHFVLLLLAMSLLVYMIYLKRKEKFTYSFDENGGELVKPIEESQRKKIVLPKAKKQGYDFAGWYYDPELTKPFDRHYRRGKDITLYAKWKKSKRINTMEENRADIDSILIQYNIKKPPIEEQESKVEGVVESEPEINYEEIERQRKIEELNRIIEKAKETAPKRVLKKQVIIKKVIKPKEVDLSSMTEDEKLDYFISRAKTTTGDKKLNVEEIEKFLQDLGKKEEEQ